MLFRSVKETKPAASSKPVEDAPSDFFTQFNQPAQEPAKPAPVEEPQDETPAWMKGSAAEAQTDDLRGWLSQPTAQSPAGESFNFESTPPPAETDWMSNLGAPASQEPAAPASEDLGWLRDLEASSKPASTPETPQTDMGWAANLDSASGSQEDLRSEERRVGKECRL